MTTKTDKPKRQSRRGRGEGTVRQRPDGLWEARIECGTDDNGKRIRKSVYGATKKAVTDELTKLANKRLDGTLTSAGRMTVGDFLDRWLENSARLDVAPTTYARYESLIRLHIKPQVGSMKLGGLQVIHIKTMLATMERDKIGAETRRYSLQVLQTALNVAVDWDLIGRNPCDKVDAPKVTRREIAPLEPPQIKKLIEAAAGHRLKAVFVVALTTGLRQGELFGLHWKDVDLDNGSLAVRYSLEEIAGKLRLKEPKSTSGRRVVRLPVVAVNALEDHKAAQEAEGLEDCPLVFCDRDGQFLRKSNFERRVWKPIRDAAKIPKTVTFHDTRHTAASLLIKAGSHPKIIQSLLGHSTVQLSMNRYGHLMDGMDSTAAGHFDAIAELKPAPKAIKG